MIRRAFIIATIMLSTTASAGGITAAKFPLDRGESMMPTPKTEILLFSATWCGPCQSLKAQLKKEGLYNRVKLMDCSDGSQFKAYSKKYGFRAVPTVIVIRNGKEIARGGLTTVRTYAKR